MIKPYLYAILFSLPFGVAHGLLCRHGEFYWGGVCAMTAGQIILWAFRHYSEREEL